MTPDDRPPVTPASIVTESEGMLRAAAEGLRADGWSVARSWQLPEQPWDLTDQRRVCVGSVAASDEVPPMLLAAIRGAVVIVRCTDPTLRAAVIDELSRVTLTEDGGELTAASPLTEEQQQLVELLAAGAKMADAAGTLFLSVRTAERRLAEVRRALGVSTTAEALVVYRRSN